MKRAVELVSGSVKLTTMDEHTPNAGLVLSSNSQGVEREIDFVEAPLGLSARDVRETASSTSWKAAVEDALSIKLIARGVPVEGLPASPVHVAVAA